MRLDCGATVTLTVRVERRGCQLGGYECPTAGDVAGMIWLSLQAAELETPREQ